MEERQMGTPKKEPVTIDLMEVFRAIWRQKVFVILLTLIVAAAAFAVTRFLIQPTYRTSMTVYVNNRSNSDNQQAMTSADTVAGQSLTYTYSEILTSRELLKEAASQINLNASYAQLKNMVSTSIVTNSQLIDLSVTTTDPNTAYDMAKSIEKIAPDYMARSVEGSSMKVVSKAVRPTSPYAPSIPRNTAIGAILGFLVAVVIVVIQDIRDDRVKSADDLVAKYHLPIVGTIPNFEEAAENKQSKYSYRGV